MPSERMLYKGKSLMYKAANVPHLTCLVCGHDGLHVLRGEGELVAEEE